MNFQNERLSCQMDVADATSDLLLKVALENQRRAVLAAETLPKVCVVPGCGEPTVTDKKGKVISKFCSIDCRDDYERLQKLGKLK